MRSAGLKNITAKHLGAYSLCDFNAADDSPRISVFISHRRLDTIYQRIHSPASESETSSHADGIR
jgi:hypothetical protein